STAPAGGFRSNALRAAAAQAYDESGSAFSRKGKSMRGSRISWTVGAAALVVISTPAAAFNCYAILDRSNEVVYQGALSPVDLSDDGAPARDAVRARGQQLIAMDTDHCPAIDRINLATRGGPATVEEIVAGTRPPAP